MSPPMKSDNVLSHSKAIARFFVQKYFTADQDV
jgi:hypothetical protein